ncbi:hypothetical protein [Chryseobacterium sp. JUb7]|uniref:hypothetical protein n=1 Tax=Chryseobacterium sp. JUb7 TaxID=2940599 RepID=UPI002169A9AA|nr:hypothetical protein [Chryseobacterium sp. JUb7]MCS3529380.1 hypothetical protein [Chryseobacterium sp. JUb7]
MTLHSRRSQDGEFPINIVNTPGRAADIGFYLNLYDVAHSSVASLIQFQVSETCTLHYELFSSVFYLNLF